MLLSEILVPGDMCIIFPTIWPLSTFLYFRVFKGLLKANPNFRLVPWYDWSPCCSSAGPREAAGPADGSNVEAVLGTAARIGGPTLLSSL